MFAKTRYIKHLKLFFMSLQSFSFYTYVLKLYENYFSFCENICIVSAKSTVVCNMQTGHEILLCSSY